jgi:hypothetical protein
MSIGGVVFAALIVLLTIPFAIEVRRRFQGTERTLGTVAVLAAALVGLVNVAKSLGWMPDGPLYWTLNIALVVLFWAMVFQLSRGKRSA